MNHATIKSLMHLMPINAQLNWIRKMCISRLDFNYCVVVRLMECRCKQAHLFLKMSTLKPTKQPVLSAPQDLNGEPHLNKQHRQDLPLDLLLVAGGADSLKSILHLIRQILTINVSLVAVPVKYPGHLVCHPLGRMSKCDRILALVLELIEVPLALLLLLLADLLLEIIMLQWVPTPEMVPHLQPNKALFHNRSVYPIQAMLLLRPYFLLLNSPA